VLQVIWEERKKKGRQYEDRDQKVIQQNKKMIFHPVGKRRVTTIVPSVLKKTVHKRVKNGKKAGKNWDWPAGQCLGHPEGPTRARLEGITCYKFKGKIIPKRRVAFRDLLEGSRRGGGSRGKDLRIIKLRGEMKKLGVRRKHAGGQLNKDPTEENF